MTGIERAQLDKLHKNPSVGCKAIYSGKGGILVAVVLETAGEIIIWTRVDANRCRRIAFYNPRVDEEFDAIWMAVTDELLF
jgi:hypothetical protein